MRDYLTTFFKGAIVAIGIILLYNYMEYKQASDNCRYRAKIVDAPYVHTRIGCFIKNYDGNWIRIKTN
jgi:hypothetical protein